jgi:hypothetical protein
MHVNHPPKFRKPSLSWRRAGDTWLLFADRRRLGRVVPDAIDPMMWRSLKPGGQLSAPANLSWTKSAVLVAAERELEFEARQHRAIDPPNCSEKGGGFPGSSSLVRLNGAGDTPAAHGDKGA